MKKVLFAFLLACSVVLALGSISGAARAEGAQVDSRRLMVPPKNADGTINAPPIWQDPVLWARDQQQNFYGQMSKAMKGLRQGGGWAAAYSLMLLSFGYGVFHAAGPGHGKAVISAWLLATENDLRRGVLVALMSAIVQAVTAITLVSTVLLLVSGAGSAAKDMAAYLESASFALIAAMGAYLLWTGLKAMGWRFPQMRNTHLAVSATAGITSHHFEITNPLPAQVGHVHGPDCGCDHAHLPAVADVREAWSWGKAFSLAFAVGIRPCTGALLVLIFANALGLYWAGVLSTFVMAFGTFLTVSAVASIAVYSKKLAERLAARDTHWLGRLATTLRLGGGIAIFLFGALLFIASLSGPVGNM
jgi:ABC-type nickel/cobalt efflux system permease component RcnA